MRALAPLACLLCLISPAAASPYQAPAPETKQEPAKQAEAYRLRIANTLYGPVEVSTDGGKSWTLIARVNRAALSVGEGGTSATPAVERSSGNGIALAIGGRRLIRLLPDVPANYKNNSGIVVGMPQMAGLFKDLAPPAGASLQQVVNKREIPLPTDYVPQDGDVLLITVPQGAVPADKLQEQVKLLGDRYLDGVATRLRTQGKKPTSGILTLTVNLAPGERASALTFYLDGDVVGIQNQPPFVLKLDTKRWPNGEHVLEARAMDQNGAVLTRKKTLVYVENGPE